MALGIGTKNIGIDLGTANTIVYIDGKGIVLREPSVVARNSKTNEVISVGEEARDMIGRTPASIVAIRPMKDGVIADYDTTVAMMQYYMQKALGKNAGKPYVMVCVPSGITEVEKRAVIDATRVAGARDAYVIEEPFAAAIGAGLPVMDQDEVYSGCYAKVKVALFAYSASGNRGIGASLEVIQKVRDGERLGGSGSGLDGFEDEGDDDLPFPAGDEDFLG